MDEDVDFTMDTNIPSVKTTLEFSYPKENGHVFEVFKSEAELQRFNRYAIVYFKDMKLGTFDNGKSIIEPKNQVRLLQLICHDVVNAVSGLVKKYEFTAMDYCAWYMNYPHSREQTTYEDMVVLKACELIVTCGITVPIQDWESDRYTFTSNNVPSISF